MNKSILSLIVACFIIINLGLWGYKWLKNKDLKNQEHEIISGTSLVKSIKLPYFHLENDNGTVLDSNRLIARLNVLIFFTFEDCPACLYEAVYWGEAAQVFNRSDVSFWGITPEKDRKKIQEFALEYQLSFPIIFDKDGKLKEQILSIDNSVKKLSITTPFKVFVKQNQEIIRIEGPKKEVEDQKLFLKIISRILSD